MIMLHRYHWQQRRSIEIEEEAVRTVTTSGWEVSRLMGGTAKVISHPARVETKHETYTLMNLRAMSEVDEERYRELVEQAAECRRQIHKLTQASWRRGRAVRFEDFPADIIQQGKTRAAAVAEKRAGRKLTAAEQRVEAGLSQDLSKIFGGGVRDA